MIGLAEAIYDELSANAAILAYVTATDIHWGEAPMNASVNRIVFRRVADPPIYDSDDRFQLWRFWIHYENRHDCERLAEVLYNQIHRKDDDFSGTDIDYVACVMNLDPVFVSELNAYEVIQDYTIYHH